MVKLIVPCNVCVKRFYRAYTEVDENATDEEIRKAMIEAIVENQDIELTEDPDIGIEDNDIVYVEIDHEGAWTEEDEEDIKSILHRKKCEQKSNV